MTAKNLLLASLIVLSIGCKKDDTPILDKKTTESNTNSPSNSDFENTFFGNTTTRSFIGTVLNSKKLPIQNAEVSIKNNTVLTDHNGVFSFNAIDVNDRFAHIKVKKDGFLNTSRSVVPTDSASNVSIIMLEEKTTKAVSSGETSKIDLDNGASVQLDGNFINADGTPYTGEVNVILHYLNPENDDTQQQMPGMLYAKNNDGEERMLQTFGMLAVKLKSESGEPLNISPDSEAILTAPVPSKISSPPATMPLWYFDENKGYWIEEGEAILKGNTYIGKVNHFSFWNFDLPFETVSLCVTLKDTNNTPITNTKVVITGNSFDTRTGFTNSSGEICGFVPKNESLVIRVFNNECGDDPKFITKISPLLEDTSKTITVDTDAIKIENVTGKLISCSETPVENGYAILLSGNRSYIAEVTNGNFNFNITKCDDNQEFIIEGFDYDNSKTTGVTNHTFTSPTTNVGTLKSCDEDVEFLQYTFDGKSYRYTNNFEVSLKSYTCSIRETPPVYFRMHSLRIEALNSKELNLMSVINDTDNFKGSHKLGDYYCNSKGYLFRNSYPDGVNIDPNYDSTDIIVQITSINGVGNYVDINFNGTYWDGAYDIEHTLSAVYHVKLDEIIEE